MFSKKFSLMATITLISVTTTPVFAMPMYGNNSSDQIMAQRFEKDREDGWERGRFLDRLNLTDAQKKQIEALKKEHENEMKPLKDQLRIKENELRNLMVNNASNEQLKNKHNEIQSLRQKLGNLHFENMLALRSVLTAEQRSQFGQMMGYRGEGKKPSRR